MSSSLNTRQRVCRSLAQAVLTGSENYAAVQVSLRNRPPSPDEIAFVTGYTHHVASFAEPIASSNASYAARHGYPFILHRDADFDQHRHPAWSKIRFLERALRRHRWAFWCDADAIVMNHRIRLEQHIDPAYDMIIGRWGGPIPPPHVNSGVFFLQHTAFSWLFLKAVWHLPGYVQHYWWEQGAIIRLLELFQCRRIKQVARYRDFNAFVGVAGP